MDRTEAEVEEENKWEIPVLVLVEKASEIIKEIVKEIIKEEEGEAIQISIKKISRNLDKIFLKKIYANN